MTEEQEQKRAEITAQWEKLDSMTEDLGIEYIKAYERDYSGFVDMLIKFQSMRSFSRYFYDLICEQKGLIDKIESISEDRKRKYWNLIKESKLSDFHKKDFCKGLYVIEEMLGLLHPERNK